MKINHKTYFLLILNAIQTSSISKITALRTKTKDFFAKVAWREKQNAFNFRLNILAVAFVLI